MIQRILAIDDDRETTGSLRRLLENNGYEVRELNDSTRALQSVREFQPQAVILDFLMPDPHGGDVAWQLASDSRFRDVKVIVCSALEPAELRSRLPPGRVSILHKPVDAQELLRLLGGSAAPTG